MRHYRNNSAMPWESSSQNPAPPIRRAFVASRKRIVGVMAGGLVIEAGWTAAAW